MARIVDAVLRARARVALFPRLARLYASATGTDRPAATSPGPTIAVGVLTYNRPACFRQVIEAVVEHFSPLADLYVYNDGSQPNEEYRRLFATLPPAVQVIDASENRGVAHAKNALLEAMADHDFLFLLEDDLVPLSPEAVTAYVEASQRTGIEHFNFAHHGSANEAGPIAVSTWVEYYRECVGAWSMYSRRAIATVGPFDERFPNAWEHVEHTHRLAKAGLTSPFGRFADLPGSKRWLRELPEGIETSTIRNDPAWLERMRDGLEYWARKDPQGFPLRRLLRKLRAGRVRRPAPPPRRSPAVVVVPVYQEAPSPSDRLSFEQCLRVLSAHPIALVAPEGLRLDAYDAEGRGLMVRRFPSRFFHSPRTYNRLMLSPAFYRAFWEFPYLLIYQLDAWVFSDRLLDWCQRGYDYVGAPWVDAPWLAELPIRRPRWSRSNIVGNGGFSLRRTRACWALASLFRRAASRWPANEDGFWAFYAPSYWPAFRLPPTEEALRFSFELSPAKCYELSGRRLPFGCHAWEKHDPAFWRGFIPAPSPSRTDREGSHPRGGRP